MIYYWLSAAGQGGAQCLGLTARKEYVQTCLRCHASFEFQASFTIDPPALLAGAVPRRQQHLILAWAELHQEELLANWDRAAQEVALHRIKGLD